MGTRSTTHFYMNEKHLVSLYKQYDGYLEGWGEDLKNFLNSGKFVNGYGLDKEKQFNGFGCMIAQLISEFKEGVGGLYVTNKEDLQEYNYTIKADTEENTITLSVVDCEGEYEELLKLNVEGLGY